MSGLTIFVLQVLGVTVCAASALRCHRVPLAKFTLKRNTFSSDAKAFITTLLKTSHTLVQMSVGESVTSDPAVFLGLIS